MRRQRICEYELTLAEEMLARAYSAEGAAGGSAGAAPLDAEKPATPSSSGRQMRGEDPPRPST